MAVQTKGRTGLYVQTFADTLRAPVLRTAVEMDAFEERLHKIVLQESNFTLNGSKELGVEITFPELARICLSENDRQLAPYDTRLLRPRFVPAMIRLALRFAGKN